MRLFGCLPVLLWCIWWCNLASACTVVFSIPTDVEIAHELFGVLHDLSGVFRQDGLTIQPLTRASEESHCLDSSLDSVQCDRLFLNASRGPACKPKRQSQSFDSQTLDDHAGDSEAFLHIAPPKSRAHNCLLVTVSLSKILTLVFSLTSSQM